MITICPSEIDDVLDTMSVIVDTREQDTPQSRRRYKAIGVPVLRRKLDYGDYTAAFTLPDGSEFVLDKIAVIERKMHLDELEQCFTKGRKRFAAEFDRAKEAGATVYLLIENATWDSAYLGSYKSHMAPQAMTASMLAWSARYGCRIIMVSERFSGRMIHDILLREAREHFCRIAKDGLNSGEK